MTKKEKDTLTKEIKELQEWMKDSCGENVQKEELPLIRNKVTKTVYIGGKAAWKGGPSAEVWLYEVENGGHSWAAKDMDTYGEIWKFFKKYLR